MTDTTATLYDVTSFDGRVFPLGDYRRVIRGVVIGVGAAAAACALVTSVTVTATWIVSATLSTKPTHGMAPIGPWTLALAKYDLTLVRLKLPAHCVRFRMRISSACCAAFAFCPDGTRAKPY